MVVLSTYTASKKQCSTSELFATIGLFTIRTSDVNLEDFGQQGSSDTLRVLQYSDDTWMIHTQVGVFHLTNLGILVSNSLNYPIFCVLKFKLLSSLVSESFLFVLYDLYFQCIFMMTIKTSQELRMLSRSLSDCQSTI